MLTTRELLAGLGGSPAEAGGDSGYLEVLDESLSCADIPSPNESEPLYLIGDVERSPADLIAASSSCFEGSLIGADLGPKIELVVGLPQVAAALLTEGNSTFSLSSPTGGAISVDGGAGNVVAFAVEAECNEDRLDVGVDEKDGFGRVAELTLISGVGVDLSDSEADFCGVVGLSFSAGFADMVDETALTAADFGGGCNGDAPEGKTPCLGI